MKMRVVRVVICIYMERKRPDSDWCLVDSDLRLANGHEQDEIT